VTERRTETLYAGQYFLAVQGMALMRAVFADQPSAVRRVDEIREIAARLDEFPHSLAIPLIQHDVEDGYTQWAPVYDGPNPAIEGEQPIVHEILAELPVGVALDAACGTGRHAAKLFELGHQVIGVDTTEAMLAVAREKVQGADFRRGRLEDLPLDDASVDVITCSLALTHVPDLVPVLREFGRVLRAGGTAVLSDMHPFNTTMGGGIAGWPSGDLTKGIPYVVNLVHQVSDYIAAFAEGGFSIDACIEPRFGETQIEGVPSYPLYPDASRQAFMGSPYLLIWRLRRTSPVGT
jgi:ubiquinone/menaquinone biosynthesis C-methylase UbiE